LTSLRIWPPTDHELPREPALYVRSVPLSHLFGGVFCLILVLKLLVDQGNLAISYKEEILTSR
jgi:hypothetical protein